MLLGQFHRAPSLRNGGVKVGDALDDPLARTPHSADICCGAARGWRGGQFARYGARWAPMLRTGLIVDVAGVSPLPKSSG